MTFRTPLRLTLALLAILALAACSTMGQSGLDLTAAPDAYPSVPAAETLGDGGLVVGVVSAPGPLPLAARLAALGAHSGKVRFELRTVASPADASRAGAELAGAGASIVIAGLDADATLALRQGLAASAAPVLSIARQPNPIQGVYWAGFSPDEAAGAIATEAARRGQTELLLTATPSFQPLAASLSASAQTAGFALHPLSGAPAPEAAATVCLAPVAICHTTIAPRPELAGLPLIGHPGWALEETGIGPLDWHIVPADSRLPDFAALFSAQYGVAPTLDAALLYDLVTLADALPAVVETSPFAPDILTNSQGFKGYSGHFRLNASGIATPRTYTVSP